MNKKELYVKDINGGTQIISIPNNEPLKVYDLKKMINKDEPYMLRLLHNNQELDDDNFLNETHIQNGDNIYYLMKLNREVEILLEIKRKMNIPFNWSRDQELSEWKGIVINHENNVKFKVSKLVLYNLELTGEIPTEIGKLVNLEYLILPLNKLTGEIPTEIGKLCNLKWLHLNYNRLTGKIPTEIGKLSNLVDLIMFCNDLTGEIPKEIGELCNLKQAVVDNNLLIGENPTEIVKLMNLENTKFT